MSQADPADPAQGEPLAALLQGEGGGARRGRKALRIGLAALAALLAVAAVVQLRRGPRDAGPRFVTERVAEGTLVVKISATGNLQPTHKVEVSSELSGIVTLVAVDDNDKVKKGQVLARLDLSRLRDAVTKSRAALAAAEAGVLQAQATTAESRATLARYHQVAALSGGKVPSRAELETAETTLSRAEANQASARAAVVQARADLQSDETNLGKASIRSPIDGLVLSRAVDPGQTVAASLQAPVLFTLAEDLSQMKLEVNVDEADIGQVQVGQRATFTVDAWPGRKYAGTITRVAYGSQTKDNVVCYPTVITVKNDDLSLRPGMTGTAEIVTVTREKAKLVPNAALRFAPPARDEPPGGAAAAGGGFMGKLLPRPPVAPAKQKAAPREGAPRVFVLRDGRPDPVEVQTGASNGQWTEITGGTLEVGAPVITESAGGQP